MGGWKEVVGLVLPSASSFCSFSAAPPSAQLPSASAAAPAHPPPQPLPSPRRGRVQVTWRPCVGCGRHSWSSFDSLKRKSNRSFLTAFRRVLHEKAHRIFVNEARRPSRTGPSLRRERVLHHDNETSALHQGVQKEGVLRCPRNNPVPLPRNLKVGHRLTTHSTPPPSPPRRRPARVSRFLYRPGLLLLELSITSCHASTTTACSAGTARDLKRVLLGRLLQTLQRAVQPLQDVAASAAVAAASPPRRRLRRRRLTPGVGVGVAAALRAYCAVEESTQSEVYVWGGGGKQGHTTNT